MMNPEQILYLLREQHKNYAAQDNTKAAHTARVLAHIIEQIEEPTPEDIEVLKRRFLG